MAHMISTESGRAELAYFGAKPWHGLGTEVPELMRPCDALTLAGLNWDTMKVPTFYRDAAGQEVASGYFATVRSDTMTHLGDVGGDFEPWHNREACDFIGDVVGKARGSVEVAGALMGGSRIFWVVRCPELFTVGAGDKVETYLLVTYGHDGKVKVKIMGTRVRVVCYNTLSAALAGGAVGVDESTKHTSGMRERLDVVSRRLVGIREEHERTVKAYEAMRARELAEAEAISYFANVLPLAEGAPVRTVGNVERARSAMLANFRGGRGADLAGPTLWGAYNAVTEYGCHQRPFRGTERVAERRFLSVTEGAAANLDTRALSLAVAMLN